MNTFMVAAFAIAASAAVAAANATKTLTLPGGATMELIYVSPGAFTMGSQSSEAGCFDDETQHQVTLTKGFWLGKYEVTQRQWRSVMGNNPSRCDRMFIGDDGRRVKDLEASSYHILPLQLDPATGEARLMVRALSSRRCCK